MFGEARAGAEEVGDLLVVMKQATKGRTDKTVILSAQCSQVMLQMKSLRLNPHNEIAEVTLCL